MPQIHGHCQAHITRFKSQGSGNDVVTHFVIGNLHCVIPDSGRHVLCHFDHLASLDFSFDYD